VNFTLPFCIVTIDIYAFFSLLHHHGVEETDNRCRVTRKCQLASYYCHCKSLSRQLFFKGSKHMKIAEHKIRTIERVVHNLPAVVP